MKSQENIIHYLRENVAAQPDKSAYIFLENGETEKESFTYKQLDQKSTNIAIHLLQVANPGDRILLCNLPGLDFVLAFMGCLYAGMIAVPAYPLRNNNHARRLYSVIKDCEPSFILGTAESLTLMREHESFRNYQYLLIEELDKTVPTCSNILDLSTINSKTLAFLQYTSGSTGEPKGVMVNHSNIIANLKTIHHCFALQPEHMNVSWLPVQHDMGLIGHLLYNIYRGSTEVLIPPASFLEKPIRWLNAISHYKAYGSGGPNFGYQLCVDRITDAQMQELDLSSWEIAFTGSEPIRAATLQMFSQKFAKCGFNINAFSPCYGMAETTLAITGKVKIDKPALITAVDKQALKENKFIIAHNLVDATDLVSSGQVHEDYRLKIVNPDSLQACIENEIGEIWVAGDSVAQGYWDNKKLTRKIFHAKLVDDKNKYLRTGDLGYVDGTELYVTGRLKDLIILQGRNIYPQDIETAVESCSSTLRAGCIAAFSIEVEQQEQLVIVAEVERTHRKDNFQSVFSAIRQAIINIAEIVPYNIVLIAPAKALRTTSGKIQRQATKQAYLEKQFTVLAQEELYINADISDKSLAELETDICSMLAKILAVPEVDPNATFSLLGGSSLEAIIFNQQLQTYVGNKFKLSPTIAFDYPTAAKLAEFIYKKIRGTSDESRKQWNTIEYNSPIAIIGMNCRFPGKANNPEEFWNLLHNGEEAISVVDKERWDVLNISADKQDIYYAGLLENVDLFDSAFFNISPREAETMDPQQRLLLEVSWHALENAGINPSNLSASNTAVFVGATTHDYGDLLQLHQAHDSYLPTGNNLSVLAGRISYFLGLRGPSLTIDTACSSSLVALSQACLNLQTGDSDLAIAGGVNVLLSPNGFINLSSANMLAKDGHCKVFAEQADGYVRGEGCAVVILKKLADAKRDGDRILGVIKSAVVNQDGASSGLTVPNGVAQEELLHKALLKANLNAADIDYIETHGTGTKLGDPMETHAIAEVYSNSHRIENPLWIGSVKANIGHLEAAAGIAGLIKVLLSLQYQEIPAQPNITTLNSKIDLTVIPGQIATQTVAWPAGQKTRRAAISSFGFSGTNAHIIIEECEEVHSSYSEVDKNQYYWFPFSAKTPEGLSAQILNYKDFLEKNIISAAAKINLSDMSHTLQVGREHLKCRAAFVAKDRVELCQLLNNYSLPILIEKYHSFGFVYTDIDEPQRVIHKLSHLFPVFSAAIDECQSFISEAESLYLQTFCAQYGLAKLWNSWGIQPQYHCGTGVGLYTAALISGSMSLKQCCKYLLRNNKTLQNLPFYEKGLIIFSGQKEMYDYLDSYFPELFIVHAINENTLMVSGNLDKLKMLHANCEKNILQWISMKVYDYRLANEDILVQLQDLREKFEVAPGILSKINVLIEIGSDHIISHSKARTDFDFNKLYINSLQHDIDPSKSLYNGLAQLYSSGFNFNQLLFNPAIKKKSKKIALPLYPFQRQRYWSKFLMSRIVNNSAINKTDLSDLYQIQWHAQDVEHLTETAAKEEPYLIYISEISSQKPIDEYFNLLAFLQGTAADSKHKQLYVITRNAYSVLNSNIILQSATLNGLINTARLEYNHLTVKQIDIEEGVDRDTLLSYVKSETQRTDLIIAYRNNKRYTSCLASVNVIADSVNLKFDPSAYYLITGGLSEIGLALTEWLIAKGAQHIVLIARNQPGPEKKQILDVWRLQGCEIDVSVLDINNAEAVNDLIRYYKHGVYPLKGVFHLAGALDDAPLAKQTPESFIKTFSGKALGAWHLHEAMQQHYILLDYFVLFSSVASLQGSPGQANYASANAFLDGLALFRRQHHLPAISINWGPWAEIGKAKTLTAMHLRSGFTAFPTTKALVLLEQVLQLNPVQIAVLQADWARVVRSFPVLKPWVKALLPYSEEPTNAENWITTLAKLSEEQQQSALEDIIIDNLKQVLDLPTESVIDKNQSFFSLGLDSLMGLQLINRLREKLGNNVSIQYEQVLQKNTVLELAPYLLTQIASQLSYATDIIPRQERTQPLALSFAQERLWFLQQMDPTSRTYGEIASIEINGLLDKEKVARAFHLLIERHEGLRTRFLQDDAIPLQIIDESLTWELNYKNLSSDKNFDHSIKELLLEESLKTFNLETGPLFRGLLIQIAENRYVLTISLHHIIADGWSIGVLVREFIILYTSLVNGKDAQLAPLSIQYADYSAWQRRHADDALLTQQLDFWKLQLADVAHLNLPLDFTRPKVLTDAGEQYYFTVPDTVAIRLKQICQQQDVTLYMILLSVFYVLLMRYSNQTDICIGSPIANRTRPETENLIGFFVNMIVLRIDMQDKNTFSELLQQVKNICLKAYAHQDISFEKIVEVLTISRDTSHTPLFDVMLVLQNTPLGSVEVEGLDFKLLPRTNKISKFDLTLEFMEINGELLGNIEYRTCLFKAETMERFAQHYLNLLTVLSNNIEQSFTTVDFLTADERRCLLVDWNNTTRKLPRATTFNQLFEAQVAINPNHTAIIYEDKSLTYQELNNYANQLARVLQSRVVGKEAIIAICMDRSIENVISILAILKAGGAYLPIDPNIPAERIQYMLSDSGAKLCVTCEPWAQCVSDIGVDLLLLDNLTLLSGYADTNIFSSACADNIAYIVYTSGSTGKPKGVEITHHSMVNFMQWLTHTVNFISPMRFLSRTSVGFDVAVSDTFIALLQSGTLVIVPPGEHIEPLKLITHIKKYEITFIELTPSQLLAILNEPEFAQGLSLQAVAVGGEAVTKNMINNFYKHCKQPLINFYGPSECTVTSNAAFLNADAEIISIGGPIDNTQIYVMDRFNNLAPIGAVGELCIGGIGLARGYLNRHELTAEKFVKNPWGSKSSRLYRTGDLVRYLQKGCIEFLGRVDHQVKIRGYRIELGEVENMLTSYPGIEQVVVMAREYENNPNDKYLIAYLTLVSGANAPDTNVLRSYLQKQLPDYMLPNFYIFLAELPMNANAKLDRNKLPLPDKLDHTHAYIEPRTLDEKIITRIYADVLNREKIGIDDGFFDLGGHSLLAVKVINELRKQLNREGIPLTIIFQFPTARQMAMHLQSADIFQFNDMVCLQAQGNEPPLFLVPGSDGFGIIFTELARQVAELSHNSRPVYSFQYPKLFKEINFDSIESLASYYVQRILSQQKTGPYFIAGWSMGGIVAYEMCKQLTAQGFQVEFLGILDITPDFNKKSAFAVKPLIASFLADGRFGIPEELLPDIIAAIEETPEDELINSLSQQLQTMNNDLAKAGKLFENLARNLVKTLAESEMLLNNYVLSGKVNKISYFSAAATGIDKSGWQKFCSDKVKTYTIPGDHFTMLQLASAQMIAKEILTHK